MCDGEVSVNFEKTGFVKPGFVKAGFIMAVVAIAWMNIVKIYSCFIT